MSELVLQGKEDGLGQGVLAADDEAGGGNGGALGEAVHHVAGGDGLAQVAAQVGQHVAGREQAHSAVFTLHAVPLGLWGHVQQVLVHREGEGELVAVLGAGAGLVAQGGFLDPAAAVGSRSRVQGPRSKVLARNIRKRDRRARRGPSSVGENRVNRAFVVPAPPSGLHVDVGLGKICEVLGERRRGRLRHIA